MIEEEIWEYLEWTEEDSGIGWYQYGNGHYNDVELGAVLETTEVEMFVDFTEEYIPLTFTSSKRIYTDDEHDYEVSIIVTLDSVQSMDNKFRLVYTVEEN
jgi:hypothetical protein